MNLPYGYGVIGYSSTNASDYTETLKTAFITGINSFTTGNNTNYIRLVVAKGSDWISTISTSVVSSLEAIISLGSSIITPSINVDGEEIYSKPVVLWQNSSPNSSFSGQAITLNDSLDNYNYYEIIYIKNSFNDRKYLSTGKIPTNQFAYMQCLYKYNSFRQITNIDNTNKQITFSNGTYYTTYAGDTTGQDTSLCVPYRIIGYK
jgi:hypothetical protein